MNTTKHGLNKKELAKLLMADCKSSGDIQNKLKSLILLYLVRGLAVL